MNARAVWRHVVLSAMAGWFGFFLLASPLGLPAKVVGWITAVLAAFHATTFLHELSHLPAQAAPGVRSAWNVLWGAPLMLPSWTYERIHAEHHHPRKYGTPLDPEYPPVAHFTTAQLVRWSAVGLALPVVLWFRFALITPFSYLHSDLRRFVLNRLSALTTDTNYRPVPFAKGEVRFVGWTEALAMLCAWGWAASVFFYPRWLMCFGLVIVPVVLLQQLRTILSHSYISTGEPRSIEEVLLDSFNFELSSSVARWFWPASMRFHGLHHLAPAIPFHALAEAHSRLIRSLPRKSVYFATRRTSTWQVVKALIVRCRANDARMARRQLWRSV